MIPLLLLFLVGSCHTMNPSHKTANASLLNLCLHESPYCTELGPDETCNSRGSEQIQRYNTEICQVNVRAQNVANDIHTESLCSFLYR